MANNSLVYIYAVIYFILRCQSCWCCQLRQPKSVEDYKKSVDNAVPESTAYKTKWVCTLFEEWKQNRLVRSCALKSGGHFTTKDFEEGVQTLDTGHYRNVTRSKQLFWGTVSFRSLYSIIRELKRHLSDVNGRAALNPLVGHVRRKVSYILGGIKFGSRKLLVCIVVFNSTSFLALLSL